MSLFSRDQFSQEVRSSQIWLGLDFRDHTDGEIEREKCNDRIVRTYVRMYIYI